MKIATFNVNGITARLPRLLEWLAESSPDVACLQELKTSDETFPVAALRDAGYSAVWHGQKGWNGVAILATRRRPGRAPARPARRPGRHPQPLHRGERARHGRRLDLPAQRQPAAGAEVRLQAGLVRAPRRACRRAWSASDQPVVLAGDYNVVASDEIGDIYSPRSYLNDALLQPETRSAYRSLLGPGLDRLDRHAAPGRSRSTPTGTTSATAFARDAGLRIDHLLLNAPAAARLVEAGVDKNVRARDKPSDHAPTWIVLS